MIYTRTNITDLDYPIDKIQKRLYNKLGWSKYECYGRAYKNNEQDLKPNWFLNGKNYQSVLLNDNHNATSFFVLDNNIDVDGHFLKAKASIIFQVNLSKLYTNGERLDFKCLNDVLNVLSNEDVINVYHTPKEVYKDLHDVEMDSYDFHPYHVFRVELNISCSINCNC